MPNPNGRPSSYTPEMAAVICDQLTNGTPKFAQDCLARRHASYSYRYGMAVQTPGVLLHNTHVARNAQLDLMAEDITEIADSTAGCESQAEVASARLRFDARRWYLSKLAPKKYGDQLPADNREPAKIEVSIRQVGSIIDAEVIEMKALPQPSVSKPK